MTLRPFLLHLDTLSEPDWVTLAMIADYCEEHGKLMRAEALRWLVENRRWVVKRMSLTTRPPLFDWWVTGSICDHKVAWVPSIIYFRLKRNNVRGSLGVYSKPSLAFADFIRAYARARRAGWVPKGGTT